MLTALEKVPRIKLGFYPTPITEAKHLSSLLGGPRILIKREDLSGLALGGNKCRKHEFILAEAKNQGANAVISTASSQSNFCLQVAAAAHKLDMKASFILLRGVHNEVQGNLLLHNILDSDIEIIEVSDIHEAWGGEISRRMEKVADDLRANGYKPFIMRHTIPDISAILGAVGWVAAADELTSQLKENDIHAQYVVLANGGGGTHAGLELGLKYLKTDCDVIGISVLNKRDAATAAVIEHTDATAAFLGLDVKVSPDELQINDSYVGEGYGIPTKECVDAIRLVAQTEGIFLDPVYTGKAMAGLIDLVNKRYFKPEDTIVFIHTGGIPALFAYHDDVAMQKWLWS